jgi:hypothetical protein
MTNETINPYRAVLEELAQNRGLSGAEELAERAAEFDPERYSAWDMLECPQMGFGVTLDSVLKMSEEEKGRVSRAWGKSLDLGHFTPPEGGEFS